MTVLAVGMSHAEAAGHLRQVVVPTVRHETGRLLGPEAPAFFGVVRAILCDLDYVAALYCGWDGQSELQIATKKKSVQFLTDMVASASKNSAYATYADHLYEAYRSGTVHLRAPKELRNAANSPGVLSWSLMAQRKETWALHNVDLEHLVPVALSTSPPSLVLPLSICGLFEDFLTSCEYFARELEVEGAGGTRQLLTRWDQTAVGLTRPSKSKLSW